MAKDFRTLQSLSTEMVRDLIRSGDYDGHTAGLGKGKLQANLALMPADHALDFMRFCQRNPKPCPLVGVSDTGDPMLRTLGADLDVRTDVPAYYIYEHGRLTDTRQDITDLWTDDMVAFVLGCSFTFEHALQAAGLSVWHIDNDTTVPMFASSIQTVPAGVFGGDMVVSMRAIPRDRLDEVVAISRRFPWAHGAPVHIGDPAEIGITDIAAPDWGDPAPIPDGCVPVFWACGVTPQVAIMRAGLPLSIAHKPGHMLITDVPDDAEIPILTP